MQLIYFCPFIANFVKQFCKRKQKSCNLNQNETIIKLIYNNVITACKYTLEIFDFLSIFLFHITKKLPFTFRRNANVISSKSPNHIEWFIRAIKLCIPILSLYILLSLSKPICLAFRDIQLYKRHFTLHLKYL